MKRATTLAAATALTAGLVVAASAAPASADSGYPAAGEGYTQGGDWGDVATTAREANDSLNAWCTDQSFWCGAFWGAAGLIAGGATLGANS